MTCAARERVAKLRREIRRLEDRYRLACHPLLVADYRRRVGYLELEAAATLYCAEGDPCTCPTLEAYR